MAMYSMLLTTLPEALVVLLSAALAGAQSRQALVLNQITSLTSQAQPRTLPASARLAVSIALCAAASPAPRFFLSNVSSSADQGTPGAAGGPGVFEIALADGQGSWTGPFPNGGILAVDVNGGSSAVPFDVGVSDGAPLHQTLSALPLLGDTTANEALLFSPPFAPFDVPQPTYPNYTLPAANMSQPPPPATTPNFNLTLFATPIQGPRTACFLATQSGVGKVAEKSLWARDPTGFRTQWLLSGLAPSTNYTAFVLQDASVSGPIWLATKSAAFSCPLVHSLPFCPSVAYAMPLQAPPAPALAHTAATLPANLTAPLLSYTTNFTTVLTTFACGRDWYSPLVGCADCQAAYRAWLCAVSLPRCAEAPAAAASSSGVAASQSNAQAPLQPALSAQPASSTPRNQFMPAFDGAYSVLLPCLEQCHATDRACPPFVGFQCPTAAFGAARSYGVGYIDAADGDGAGLTGAAADRWGNVWCNML
ncbi:stretch-activated Ca2+-permeable channel component-domain-containing protein [Pholiota molesta]|nr:stretch-activated Ca2+-permeable channel component-domain-containing protein [Pholiota molesta]